MDNVKKGRYGEYLAAKYLEERHYRVLKRNWTCHWGELDLITIRPDKKLVFVEVKYIQSSFVKPYEQFTYKKRKSLKRSIDLFFSYEKAFYKYLNNECWQLDLICITKNPFKTAFSHYGNVLM